MNYKHFEFLAMVKAYVEKNPDVVSNLIQAMTMGVEAKVKASYVTRSSAETVAHLLITSQDSAKKVNKHCNRKMWCPHIVEIIDEHLPKKLKGKQTKP